MFRRATGLIVAVLLLFVAGVSSIAQTQGKSYTNLNPKGRKAYSTPISERIIRFDVTMPSGKQANIMGQEGAMVKIGDLNEGYAYALVPIIKDSNKGAVRFGVFQLSADEQGNESIRQLENLDALPLSAITTSSDPRLQITLVSLADNTASGGKVNTNATRSEAKLTADARRMCTPKVGVAESGVDCCLRCEDGVWACGICVNMDCGCCCDKPYRCPIQP